MDTWGMGPYGAMVDLLDTDPEDDGVSSDALGTVFVNIVGVNHYDGEVNDGEMVCFEREPENMYDSNAIRVDNVLGVKVGYIERGKAAHLAPLMDGGLIEIEGVVPTGSQNIYKIPCHVSVYCGAGYEDLVTPALLEIGGLYLSSSAREDGGWESLEASVALEARRLFGGWPGAGGGSPARQPRPSQGEWSGSPGGFPARRAMDPWIPPWSPPRQRRASQAPEVREERPRLDPIAQERELETLFDQLIESGTRLQTMEPSSVICSPLMRHQKEALAWLVDRENSRGLPPFWEERAEQRGKGRGGGAGAGGDGVTFFNTLTNFSTEQKPASLRGGIFADDMGLGKTLSILALIATNRPGAPSSATEAPPATDPSLMPPTQQLEDGPSPSKRPRQGLSKYTGTASLRQQSIQRQAVSSTTNGSDQRRATLIVCPLSVLSNWTTQVDQHCVPGSLAVHWYHGASRLTEPSVLSSFDIVLTTYQTLSLEQSLDLPLQRVKWLRVVLDEAHVIKSPKTQMAQAACKLDAEFRWVVTGTPIQNKVADLYSLINFIRLEPLRERSLWVRTVERPLKSLDPLGLVRLRTIMAALALRRTKDTKINGEPIVSLPPRTIVIQPVELSSRERAVYDRWEQAGRELIGGLVRNGTALKNYASVLEIILRLRQICDHMSLCPEDAQLPEPTQKGSAASSQDRPDLVEKLKQVLMGEGIDECPICLCDPRHAVITLCAHVFCRRCIERVLQRDKEKCPICRSAVTLESLIDAPEEPGPDATAEEAPGSSQSANSTKVTELLDSLTELRNRDPTVKSVVFSQFTAMLRRLQRPLVEAGFRFVQMDGSMSASQRAAALEAFNSTAPDSPTIFLMSLKAAGVGLNLVAASRVYMLDPWWNPATEDQAMDRVHRLGQKREVQVVRFIVTDSIEERMVELQERKRALGHAAFVKKSAEEQRRIRIEDIQLLMRL